MTPISSMWPASMIVGDPPGFTVAMLLPATSPRTSANDRASSRQTRAGAVSKPDGPGVSRRRFRKASEGWEIIERSYCGERVARDEEVVIRGRAAAQGRYEVGGGMWEVGGWSVP